MVQVTPEPTPGPRPPMVALRWGLLPQELTLCELPPTEEGKCLYDYRPLINHPLSGDHYFWWFTRERCTDSGFAVPVVLPRRQRVEQSRAACCRHRALLCMHELTASGSAAGLCY